jgi:streptogramin lyase
MHMKMRRSFVLLTVVLAAAAASVSASAMEIGADKVPKRISVPGTPLAIASGYGSLWVAGHDGTTLYRINPRTGRIQARIGEGTNACGPLGIGFERVWIGHCDTGPTDAVVSARGNRLVGRVKGLAFGFGFGSAWVDAQQQNPSLLNRLDPKNLRVLDRIQGGDGAQNVVSVGGFVWSVNADGTLTQINPSSNRLVATIRYGAPGSAYGVVVAGQVWILDVGANHLYKFDPRTRAVKEARVRLNFSSDFGDPYIAVAGKHAWFATHNPRVVAGGIDRIVELNAATGKILRRRRLPFGFGPYFAVIRHSLWGSLPGEDVVLRIPLK